MAKPQSVVLPSDKLALSNLPFDEYVSQFGQLFSVHFDVREEIIHAVFSIKTGDIVGISVGGKTVTKGVYKGEVRPSIVVLVRSEENIPNLIPQVVKEVITHLQAKHHKEYYEDNEEPHWLVFAKHTDDHEQVELLSGSETNDGNASTSFPVRPGMLIQTSKENFGTVGN